MRRHRVCTAPRSGHRYCRVCTTPRSGHRCRCRHGVTGPSDTMVLIDPDRFATRLQAAGFTDARIWRANHAFGFRAIRPQTPPGS